MTEVLLPVAEWSRWIPISRCPDECGEGCVLIFTRHCQPGMFNFGSDNCPGNASMSHVLDIEECPVGKRPSSRLVKLPLEFTALLSWSLELLVLLVILCRDLRARDQNASSPLQ